MPILTEQEGKRLTELLKKAVHVDGGYRLCLDALEMEEFTNLAEKALDGLTAEIAAETSEKD
jgi:hypothetical protein